MQLIEFYNKTNQALRTINALPKNDVLDAIKIKLWHAKRLAHEMLYDPDCGTQANFNIQLKNGEDFSISINMMDLDPFAKQLCGLLGDIEQELGNVNLPAVTLI